MRLYYFLFFLYNLSHSVTSSINFLMTIINLASGVLTFLLRDAYRQFHLGFHWYLYLSYTKLSSGTPMAVVCGRLLLCPTGKLYQLGGKRTFFSLYRHGLVTKPCAWGTASVQRVCLFKCFPSPRLILFQTNSHCIRGFLLKYKIYHISAYNL